MGVLWKAQPGLRGKFFTSLFKTALKNQNLHSVVSVQFDVRASVPSLQGNFLCFILEELHYLYKST